MVNHVSQRAWGGGGRGVRGAGKAGAPPGVGQRGDDLAHEGPGRVDDEAPLLPGVQPARVAAVGPEHQHQGQRERCQLEGRVGCALELRQPNGQQLVLPAGT
jgi:hypothetical protein